MLPATLQETQSQLETAALEGAGDVLVSYSGGKDSLVLLDLCTRVFKRVVCFFMYLVPGLEVCERQLAFARDRYGVEVLQYPHWLISHTLLDGTYMPNHHLYDDIPRLHIGDMYKIVSHDTGIGIIATGARRSDSIARRQFFSNQKYGNVIYPIKSWNTFDILAYLKIRGIPPPPSSGQATSGIDLSASSLLWLYDNYPRDFARLCEFYPYAEAVVWRREWYGIK